MRTTCLGVRSRSVTELGGVEQSERDESAQVEVAPLEGARAPLDADALPKKTRPTVLGAIAGFAKPLVAGVVLATMVGTAGALGAPLETTRIDTTTRVETTTRADTPAVRTVLTADQQDSDLVELNRAVERLEAKHQRNEITAAQLAAARRVLYAGLIEHAPNVVIPRNVRGHVDVDEVIRMIDSSRTVPRTRGEQTLERLLGDLERRMRITARDMAYPGSFTPIEGAPGYKEIPADEVQRLIVAALRDVPLIELPGGSELARLIIHLPNAGHLNAEHMTINELSAAIGDANQRWLEERVRPIIEGHELEYGIVALGAVTGLRAASPEAADLIDRLSPRVTIYRGHNDLFETHARLAWRDRHIAPDLDVDAGTHTMIGARTSLRASVGGTFSAESRPMATATATIGAHHTRGNSWLDASGTYLTREEAFRATLAAGHYDPQTGLAATTNLSGVFGHGVAASGANGRLSWEIDITKNLQLTGANGDVGLYGAVAADSDGQNREARLGLMLRLTW